MKKQLPSNPATRWRIVCALLAASTASVSNAQSTLPLKDINTQQDIENSEFRSLTVGNNKVYFVNRFNELWKTTGNVSGTVRLKAFKQIGSMTSVGEALYFSADDGTGMELWKSTGTYASTVKVKEFFDGPQGGSPQNITSGDGSFFFVATTAQHGAELWKSNGTAGGTTLVKDIQPGRRGSSPRELTFINGILYFAANDGKNGYELWKSDGTAQGTVMIKDIRVGQYLGSDPRQLRNVNGTLYFTAYEPVAGRELWRSSGTTGTTSLVSDIRPGAGSPDIKNLTAVNNTLFFSANDGVHGHELWKCVGSNAALVKDLTPGKAGSHGQHVFEHPMTNFTNVAGQLFFTAYESGTYYIWKSDGTEDGTRPLEEARNGIFTPVPQFVAMGSSIYYYNAPDPDVAYYGTELRRMRTDGSGSVVIAHLVQPDFYTRYIPELVTLNRSLYLFGRNDEVAGFKLFRSNGTPGHLMMINDSHNATLGSSPSFALSHRGQVFFTAEDIPYERSLWRTDGTTDGTIKVDQQTLFGSPAMAATNSTVYYSTYHYGLNIWKTDGTTAGTEQVVVRTMNYTNYVRALATVGEMLYIHVNGDGLWRCDGTAAGTYQLTSAQDIVFMKPVGNQLYYMTVQGDELALWRTNGSQTFKVRTFPADVYHSYVKPVTKDNILYFMADDGISGNEIWRSNGTVSGTFRIADLNTADGESPGDEVDISHMEVWQNELYISARDEADVWALFKYDGSRIARVKDVHRIGLMIPTRERLHVFAGVSNGDFNQFNHWITDGTNEGTTRINDTELYWQLAYLVHEDILYYSSWDSQLWRSDGTACGTFPVDVGLPISSGLANVGNRLIFSANTLQYGVEPYVFDLSSIQPEPCETWEATAGIAGGHREVTITSYPNPFSKDISIKVAGSDKEIVEVQVFNDFGLPVETITGLSPNTEYRLGALWKPGNYFLRISKSGRLTTYQILKE